VKQTKQRKKILHHLLICVIYLKKYREQKGKFTRSQRVADMSKCWSKCTKVHLSWMSKSRDLTYNMMTTVNIVFCTTFFYDSRCS
jgi:ABC-type phosphate/phosphonate transport system permease subunit